MNPDAREFFEENPGQPYWYYSDNIRVPNPKLKPWRWDDPVPWRLPERGLIGTEE